MGTWCWVLVTSKPCVNLWFLKFEILSLHLFYSGSFQISDSGRMYLIFILLWKYAIILFLKNAFFVPKVIIQLYNSRKYLNNFVPEVCIYFVLKVFNCLIPEVCNYFVLEVCIYFIPEVWNYIIPEVCIYFVPEVFNYLIPKVCI